MKKTFAILMLATMLFSVGCGNQAQDAAKDAQQKVEQTANEAKDKAAEIKDDAAKKADEVKQDAADMKDAAESKVDEMKSDADKMVNAAADKMDSVASDMKDAISLEGRTVALNGVMPGASLEALEAMFGTATATEGDVMTFVNGLKVKFDNATKKATEISTTSNTFDTPEGMYVGADEYLLNDYCGPADTVRKIADGAEYEYDSGDKKSKVVYKSQNGIITEITCSLK